jgi:hypothetical protein
VTAKWWLTWEQIGAAEAFLEANGGAWFGMRLATGDGGGVAVLHLVQEAGDWAISDAGVSGATASLTLLVRPAL